MCNIIHLLPDNLLLLVVSNLLSNKYIRRNHIELAENFYEDINTGTLRRW